MESVIHQLKLDVTLIKKKINKSAKTNFGGHLSIKKIVKELKSF